MPPRHDDGPTTPPHGAKRPRGGGLLLESKDDVAGPLELPAWLQPGVPCDALNEADKVSARAGGRRPVAGRAARGARRAARRAAPGARPLARRGAAHARARGREAAAASSPPPPPLTPSASRPPPRSGSRRL